MKMGKSKAFLLPLILFGVIQVAHSAESAPLAPLTFNNSSLTTADLQQQEWDYLRKYKMFGATGIDFLCGKIFVPDTIGWFGTADGNFTVKNTEHKVGGPILIGGNMELDDGSDTISTGPVRVVKNITTSNFGGNNILRGTHCVYGSVGDRYRRVLNDAGIPVYGASNCPSDVPDVRTTLRIPTYKGGFPTRTLKSISADNNTKNIDIPKGDGVFDTLLSTISMSNNSRLVIRMPDGGRLTRIFVRDGISVSAHPKIQISYMDKDAKWSNGWSGSMNPLANDNYAGNLLFYTPNDIRWPAINKEDSVQGTFISEGTISIQQHMTLAGQLLANKIEINAEFDGSGFIFVPFNPSEVDITALKENREYFENDALTEIPIRLDKGSETPVTVQYCFIAPKENVNYKNQIGSMNPASKDDLTSINGDMPWCSFDAAGKPTRNVTKTVRFAIGSKTPVKGTEAMIRVKNDHTPDDFEALLIYMHVEGAVLTGNVKEGTFVLTLRDNDNQEPQFSGSDTLAVTEHIKGDAAGSVVAVDYDAGDVVTYKINAKYDASMFVINANTGAVSLKSDVEADYENKDFLHIDVVATDGKSAVSRIYTVKVKDVNEAPVISRPVNMLASVKENSPVNTRVGKVNFTDPDKFDGFTKNYAKAIGGDVYILGVQANGIIYVVNSDSLDYEKRDSYTLKVVVRDSTRDDLADTVDVLLKILDVDDRPHIVTTDTVYVDTTTGGDTIRNIVYMGNQNLGAVDENNKADVIVGAVFATCVDTSKTLFYEITKDTSGLFTIDSKTGVVTVKDSMVLDYEKVSRYGISVKVSDGVAVADGKDANGVTVQSDSCNVTIGVNDLNETPIIAQPQQFNVFEHDPVGTLVGYVVSTDEDTASAFTKHWYDAIGGDVDYFDVDRTGKITSKESLDFEARKVSGDTLFTLKIVVWDSLPDKYGNALSDTGEIVIVLKDVNEPPYIVYKEFDVYEDAKGGTPIGKLEGADLDGDPHKIVFDVLDDKGVLDLRGDSIFVKDGAKFDYETLDRIPIVVKVTDDANVTALQTIVLNIIDVNEPPVAEDATFEVSEDESIGTEIGKVIAKDPDVKTPEYSTLTYTLIGESDKFQVNPDGSIKLIDSLDYETEKRYVFDVEVSDGTYADTAKVTVVVKNVVEKSTLEIVRYENERNVWEYPDTIYTNVLDGTIYWVADSMKFQLDTTLTEGKNIIIRKYQDPHKDLPGVDTLVVFVNKGAPKVTISSVDQEKKRKSIFLVDEVIEDDPSTYYVNSESNQVIVTVTDGVESMKDSFVVDLKLKSLDIPSMVYSEKMADIVENVLPVNEYANDVVRTPVNNEKIAVSYTDTINGNPVTVTYYTDLDGDILKGESGKKEMIVSYVTVVGEDTVDVSFVANASTGRIISSSKKNSYTVSYDYRDAMENVVHVSYKVDEKGQLVKSVNDDVDYVVTYSYVNKYGNMASQSLTIVLDKKPPLVMIKVPAMDQVVYSNVVDVIWYVSVTGDSADFVVQDTLVEQGLQKGENTIVRYFRDKAGNMDSAVVYVIMKDAKDVDISVEKSVVKLTDDKVADYYDESGYPKKGQTYAVSIRNPDSGKEIETRIGGDFGSEKGSGETPYPGHKQHLGPTLILDIKAPVYNEVSGLATLDDVVSRDKKSDNSYVAVNGVDAENSEKMTVNEYVQTHCTTEFRKKLTSDYSKISLYDTKVKIKLWIYSTLGSFIDYYVFTQDLNDPEYVNDAGLLKMYFEMKPDKDGFIRTESGRLYSTGSYIFKTEVEMRSELLCDLPPINEAENVLVKGMTRKTKDDLLKSFGYKRPMNKGGRK